MMPSVVLCLGEINTDLIDTALTIGMSKWQTIYMVQIPAILPSVANSFIMMYGIGFTYIAIAETVNKVWLRLDYSAKLISWANRYGIHGNFGYRRNQYYIRLGGKGNRKKGI